MTEHQAESTIRESGCSARIIARDGRGFALTADFMADRVNLRIERGLVTSVGVY
jgi:hypothetical protein